jgi:tetratricopeptide (TPR) repeat protein
MGLATMIASTGGRAACALGWIVLGLGLTACRSASPAGDMAPVDPARATASAPGSAEDPAALVAEAQAAVDADEAARAVALYGRVLALPGTTDHDAAAYLGLAAAHEKLGDFAAAIHAYGAYLDAFPGGEDRITALARRGACEAEVGDWEASARSFQGVHEAPQQLPSTRIEAMAREGYALFNLDRIEEADAVLARADEVYEAAMQDGSERFATYYFVGMARFYRAAIVHRQFREVEIRLPEDAMAQSFKRKLELLEKAQAAYNHTIAAKHMFWVSASGFQLGHLFGELYDAIMYAPVPEWLDDRQRTVYYEELKKQLRPVIDKAVWVFEKNLETARRLGYDSEFVDATEDKLGHLQAVLLSDEATLGRPHDRLVRQPESELGPPPGAAAPGDLPAAERKLFVPRPTAL